MIHLPLGSSKELLARLERAPRIAVSFEEASRTLAADVIALQRENEELRAIAARLLDEMAALRSELPRLR